MRVELICVLACGLLVSRGTAMCLKYSRYLPKVWGIHRCRPHTRALAQCASLRLDLLGQTQPRGFGIDPHGIARPS